LQEDNDLYDVAIIGFGLIGRICAKVCSNYNLKTLVISEDGNQSKKDDAFSIDDESARFFSLIGMFRDLEKHLNSPDYRDLILSNKKVIQRNPITNTRNGFSSLYTFIQSEIFNIFEKNCSNEELIDSHEKCKLINFVNEDNYTNLSFQKGKNLLSANARYVISCENDGKLLQDKLKIKFSDFQYSKNWLIVDLLVSDKIKLENVFRQICDPLRPISYISLSKQRYRFEFQLLTGEVHSEILDKKTIKRFLSNWISTNEFEIINQEIYNFRGLCIDNFQYKNIFFLGNSAYQFPPYAGQILNTGIRDIINLTWKLNLVINYNCKSQILETFNVERKNQVIETIKSSIALGQLIDSLSVAVERNIPFDEAIAPEAREQAFGSNKKVNDRINTGLYNSLFSDYFAGKRLERNSINEKYGALTLDDLTEMNFAILSLNKIDSKLDAQTIKILQSINCKFLPNLNQNSLSIELDDILNYGDAIVRPDKKIFGVSTKDHNLNELSNDLIRQIF